MVEMLTAKIYIEEGNFSQVFSFKKISRMYFEGGFRLDQSNEADRVRVLEIIE